MPDLILSTVECQHLAFNIDAEEEYPVGAGVAGGERFVLRFIQFRHVNYAEEPGPHMLAFTVPELWLLAKVLLPNCRAAKLPDGNPVLPLLMKTWDALAEAYAEKEAPNARDDHGDADAHPARHRDAATV